MTRHSWYREADPGIEQEEHPVNKDVNRRLRERPDHQELLARILDLVRMLGHLIEGEAMQVWLSLESDMNDRCAIVAEEYYNLGVEAGQATRVVDDVLTDASVDARTSPAAAVRALVAALVRIAKQID